MALIILLLQITEIYHNQVYDLAKIIHAECGKCTYEEKLLVGSVVLNRVGHPKFSKTLIGVINQDSQFHGICNTQFILNSESLKAASDLLMNGSYNKKILYFYLRDSPNKKWRKNLTIIKKAKFHNFCK